MGVGGVGGVANDSGYRFTTPFVPQSVPPSLQVDFKLPLALDLGASTFGERHEGGFEIDLLFCEPLDGDAIADEQGC